MRTASSGRRWTSPEAARYTVFAIDLLQANRFRDPSSISGPESDAAAADVLANMVRTGSRRLRPAAAPKPRRSTVARAHKTLV
ncbi:MAG: hypothetical protein EOP31_11495 [Rhodococcus sp. (in: high G+C Gram-positive bacteria)]|uniref:hypothetical protein n=1 Tax=Rhodococcus sp. TaxID=1831 RepID=UPI0011FA37F5|nr:hypothetical protein [Rhodococcus sp. (in: high G+C Gram-positive bacteria)]RZL24927.1 MAG: hypothetical protein EOP31_11495 [Rhodococcus sp. (in: high G+C Gram-positive bacteria)]